MSNSENIAFLNNHVPSLKAGEYKITAQQEVQLDTQTDTVLNDSLSKTIYVAAERWRITQNDIVHMYPPPGKAGNFHNVVPHISLKSSTFPWERNSGASGEGIPWLWLFVFDEDDIAAGNVIAPANYPLNTVFQQPADKSNLTPYQGGLTLTAATEEKITIVAEPGETDSSDKLKTTPVSCIQINLDWLDGTSTGSTGVIMPTVDDLPLMAAVRQNETPEDPATKVEHAICMANRMPKAGKKTYACLLSLEDRLAETSYTAAGTNDATISKAYKTTGVVETKEGTDEVQYTTFVCLTHWEFDCLSDQSYVINTKGLAKMGKVAGLPTEIKTTVAGLVHNQLFLSENAFEAELDKACGSLTDWSTYKDKVIACFTAPDETFEGFMTHLSSQAFQFDPLPASADHSTPIINEYLASGAAAFTHRLNTGDKTLSWYHGPFRPSDAEPAEVNMTGILSSDQLLRFDDQLNMLDVSYAAAWELGRMLTLKNKMVAMDLYAWRKQQAWAKHNSSSRYAAVLQPPQGGSIESKEQKTIADWCMKLANLQDIPFNYLVPDERLSPKESIRFFTIDQAWVSALLDGALSIGRTSTTTAEEESATINAFNTPASRPISGFLLHSEAVSGWPHILVEAKEFKLVKEDGIEAPDITTCNLLLEKRLSTNMVLFLFEGYANEHDIHLKPEALHFGLDVPDQGPSNQYFKKVRFSFTNYTAAGAGSASKYELTATKNDPGKVSTIPYRNQDAKVLNVHKLSGDIQSIADKSTSGAPFSSAEYAMEMVEPQAHINFTQQDPKTITATLQGESDISATFVSGSDIFGAKGIQPAPVHNPINADAIPGDGAGGDKQAEIKLLEKAIEAAMQQGNTNEATALKKQLDELMNGGAATNPFSQYYENPTGHKDPTNEQNETGTTTHDQHGNTEHENDGTDEDGSGTTTSEHSGSTQHKDAEPDGSQIGAEPDIQTADGTGKPVDQLLEGILAKLNEAKSALKQDEDKLKADAEKVVDKVKGEVDHVEDKVHEAVSEVESVPEKVKAYIEKVKLDVALTEAGLKITAGLIVDRIKTDVHDDINKVKDKASQLAEGILGHIHNAETDFADKAKGAITDVKTGIKDGIEKVIDDVHLVESKAEELKTDVANHIKNMEGDVVNAAKNTLAKVEDKVRSKVAELKAEEHLARQKEAQLLDAITDKVHEVKHDTSQKISDIKDKAEADKAEVLHDAHALIEEIEAKVKAIKTNLKSEVVDKFKDLEKAAIGFFKSPFDAVKRDVQEVKEKVHDEAADVKADIAKDIQWLKARKALVWMVLGLLIISLGTWAYRAAFGGKEPTPLLSHFEGVKQMDEIEFVKQHYDEAVPVTDKDGQLEFLLSMPATVSGKMDMTQLKYELGRDSLLKITLPPVLLSDVNVDLQNVTSYDDRGKSMKLFLGGGGKAYGKAYESIIEAVEQVKKGVLSNAIKNDLMDETRQSARIYLLHLANSMGYRVEFIETKPSASFEKDIENRVGKKLWEQLKHKVRKVDPVDKPAAQSDGTESKREERRESREDKRENK